MKRIIVVGSSNVDTTLHVQDFPKPGETINATGVSEAGGGKGANQAIAAAKSGAECTFISRVGDDNFGPWMIDQLSGYGVKTGHILTTPGEKTGHAYITLNAEGQNDIMIYGGANKAMTPDMVDDIDDVLDDADFLISQFETPQEVALAAFKKAKEHNVTTILNPAPAHEIIPDLLKVTDVIAPNESECALLTGIPVTDEDSMMKSAEYFQKQGVKHLLITLGSKGVFYATPNDHGLVPAFKVHAVDTTAAGDTFIGALSSQLEDDLSNVADALVYAQRASSLTVQEMGAMPSIPTADKVKAALAEK